MIYPDKITIERLKLIHPIVRAEACKLFEDAATHLHMTPTNFIRTAYTLRTWALQAEIYAQGRTKPGKIVSNAQPGYSMHNYGLAFDIVVIKDGQAIFDNKNELWVQFAEVAKSRGWLWGGDFKSFKDYPHFEKSPRSIRDLLAKYNSGDMFTDGAQKWVRL